MNHFQFQLPCSYHATLAAINTTPTASPIKKSTWNKWKNHFSEMKRNVGMLHHEKEEEQEDAYTDARSQPHPYIIVFFINIHLYNYNLRDVVLKLYHQNPQTTTEIDKDVGMELLMTSCVGIGISLFPFFFMMWHPYIPLHFREMIFPLVAITTAITDERTLQS